MIDAVASYHLNEFRCGVAKFNKRLAKELGIPLVRSKDWACWPADRPSKHPLFSLNLAEFNDGDANALIRNLPPEYDVLFHGWVGNWQEEVLRDRATRVFGANPVIAQTCGGTPLWCPSTIEPFQGNISGFYIATFAMAHKFCAPQYTRLKELLDASGKDYTLVVSAAIHDATDWPEALDCSLRDLTALFGEEHINFRGYLSDRDLSISLWSTAYIALFFKPAVRANNTTMWAALNHGTLITNLDGDSPPELVHGETVLDINRLERLPEVNSALRFDVHKRGKELLKVYSWERLAEALR